MFKRKKKKKGKKIEVNTDGDMFPEQIVRDTREVARRVGRAAVREAMSDPSMVRAMEKAANDVGQPGPEDVLLLLLYGKGAVSPEKAMPIPKGDENETYMFFLYSDGYVAHTGSNRIYVTLKGINRLHLLGAIDEEGKINPAFKR